MSSLSVKQYWQKLDRNALALAAIVTLLLVFDFAQRVWVASPNTDTVRQELEAATAIEVEQPSIAASLQTWLKEKEQQRAEIAKREAGENQDASKPELLEGGVDVGPLRVRLRAIVLPPGQQRHVAILETQNSENRQIELMKRRLGETLGNYTLSALSVNAIVFEGNDETVTVPIFDYQRNVKENQE